MCNGSSMPCRPIIRMTPGLVWPTARAGCKASTGALLRGQDTSKQPWFSTALRGQNLGDVHDALLLSRLLVKPDKKPQRFVDIAFALKDESGMSCARR